MGRPKKEVMPQAPPPPALATHAAAAAVAAAAAAPVSQSVVIDRAHFTKVRDSVHARLSIIQDLLGQFSVDYLRQTNMLLGEGVNLDQVGDLDPTQDALSSMPSMLPPSHAFHPLAEEKKERKKRVHDPNAPKRPLTPYFLYMQTARPIIAGDLGAEAPKGAVQEEGQRRWSVMAPHEKHGWNNAYQYNLRLYNARVHAYKSGILDAKNFTDDEALTYADEHGIPQPTEVVVADDVAAVTDHDAEPLHEPVVSDPLPSPPPAQETPPAELPAKTPRKAKDARKRKTAASAPAEEAEPEPEPEPASVEEPAGVQASPEPKKRKRTSKAIEAAAAEETKKSGRKKARSS